MRYALNFFILLWMVALGGYELFDHYPALRTQLPYLSLGDFPTSVTKLNALGALVDHDSLFMKRDDLSGVVRDGRRLFGGNKVRKLELLLADARRRGARGVVTVGCAGSNHALATTVYAARVGLAAWLVLMPQANAPIVRRNLLLDTTYGAQITYVHNRTERQACVDRLMAEQGPALYHIPVGGSVALGSVGYVNAAFELKKQIEQGLLPEPDVIYIALGSGGTTAGLLLGLRAAGLHSTLRAIAVSRDDFDAMVRRLVIQTNELLHAADPSFPLFDWTMADLGIVTDFVDAGYGRCGAKTLQAITAMQCEGVTLEPTYSAKACAALLHDIPALRGKTVLFWNTFSIGDCAQDAAGVDYKTLPVALQSYFERPDDYITEQYDCSRSYR